MTKKIEWYDAANSTLLSNMSGNKWFAQSFTVGTVGKNIDFILRYAKFYLKALGTPPGVVTFSVRAWDSLNEIPTGPDIVSASITASEVKAYESWIKFLFSDVYVLKADTEYCLVGRAPSCDGINNWISWVCVSPGIYPGGSHAQSNNGGSMWTAIPQEDVGFEVWGDPLEALYGDLDLERTLQILENPTGAEDEVRIDQTAAWVEINNFLSSQGITVPVVGDTESLGEAESLLAAAKFRERRHTETALKEAATFRDKAMNILQTYVQRKTEIPFKVGEA